MIMSTCPRLLAGTRIGRPAVTVQVLVIGIGSGNLEHLTREAIAALNRVDVFIVADKGEAKHDLVELRRRDLPDVHRA